MIQRTLALIKPDGVDRKLIGEIVQRIEKRGYEIEQLKLMTVSREMAEAHYAEHTKKPFFENLVSFITSGPLVAMIIQGEEAIAGWRSMMGATNPLDAQPGTIRGDFATITQNNVTHGSDSEDSAAREIAIFFG